MVISTIWIIHSTMNEYRHLANEFDYFVLSTHGGGGSLYGNEITKLPN